MALLSDAALIDRIFGHIDNRSTDAGETVWREPTENYRSEARFRQELEVLRRVPTPFCPSAALPEAGSFVARDAAGVPILVVRGEDGVVRGFRNACRHRGMQVARGEGCKKTFLCPYHAWAYGTDGKLKHVPGEDGFPGLDKADHGLVPLTAVEERGGLVFVTQDAPLSNGPLDGMPDLLGADDIVFNVIEFVDPANWKLIGETSMEGYHIRALHNKSFYPYGFDNLNVVEIYERNSRIVFPFRRIEKLRDKPRESWRLDGMVTDTYQLFANTHISRLSNHSILVILDPISPTETRWIVYQVMPRPADGAAVDVEQARRDAAFVQDTGLLEDRDAACSIQKSLATNANEHFVFGQYEQAIGHFHKHLTAHVAMLNGGA